METFARDGGDYGDLRSWWWHGQETVPQRGQPPRHLRTRSVRRQGGFVQVPFSEMCFI